MADEELDGLTGAGSVGSEEEDPLERLSIGQRIAGVKDPAAAPPSDPAPPMPKVALDPNSIPESIRPRPMAPQQIPQPPSPSQNSALVPLIQQQAQLSKPINPMDETTGKIKPQYRMGIGQRTLGTAANFLQGFGRKPFTPVPVGPGATNWRFGREEAQREKQLEGVNQQIGTQEKLNDENEKLYRDATRQAYEGQLGEARKQTAEAQESKADTASKVADVKALATKNQFEEAKAKLEETARRNDQLMKIGQGNLELKQQLGQMALDLRQQQLENEKQKFTSGLDAKSLEAERKGRLDAIEKRYHDHPYKTMFDDKDAEIKTVNEDIDRRLQQVGVGAAKPGTAPTKTPAPQTHAWSRSAWQKANPKGDVKAAEKQARAQGFEVGN